MARRALALLLIVAATALSGVSATMHCMDEIRWCDLGCLPPAVVVVAPQLPRLQPVARLDGSPAPASVLPERSVPDPPPRPIADV